MKHVSTQTAETTYTIEITETERIMLTNAMSSATHPGPAFNLYFSLAQLPATKVKP